MPIQPGRLLFYVAFLLCSMWLSDSVCSQITTTGDLSPTYDGSDPWDMGDDPEIGITGTGSIEVAQGSDIISSFAVLGVNAGASGSVVISGAGSTWIDDDVLVVGSFGSGFLTVSDGGSVNSDGMVLGSRPGSMGQATIQGAGSSWSGSSSLTVGSEGNGSLTILNGASATSPTSLNVGFLGSSSGSLLVDGNNSLLDIANTASIGRAGVGELTISNGGQMAVSGSFFIGENASGEGTVNVIGGGSRIDAGFFVFVGRFGNGTLNIGSGGRVDASTVFLGDFTSSSGLATISGAGSVFDVVGSINIGDDGSGQMDVLDGGSVNAANIILGTDSGSLNNELNLSGNGSTINVDQRLVVGVDGAGSMRIDAGGQVSSMDGILAQNNGSSASVVIDGPNSRWDIQSTLLVGSQSTGSLRIENGGALTTNFGTIGSGTDGNGTLVVSGPGSSLTSSSTFFVGRNGTGSLTVENGANFRVTGDGTRIQIGDSIGSSGTVLVSGSGSSIMTQTLRMTAGSLTIQNGGRVVITDSPFSTELRVNGGVLNITGGELHFDATAGNRLISLPAVNFTGGEIINAERIASLFAFVQDGGTLSPGNPLGITSIGTDYEFNEGLASFDISGNGIAGVDYDQIMVEGVIDLIGSDGILNSDLGINLDYAAQIGDSFILFDNDDADLILGQFAQGNELMVLFDGQNYTFDIDYFGGTGNDITLTVSAITAIPEPTGALIIGLGLAFAGIGRHRSRQR